MYELMTFEDEAVVWRGTTKSGQEDDRLHGVHDEVLVPEE